MSKDTTSGKKFEIPKSGTLGLLALGYRGVEAWRKVRDSNKPSANDANSRY